MMPKWNNDDVKLFPNSTKKAPKWSPIVALEAPMGPGGLTMAQDVRWSARNMNNMTPRGTKMAPKGPKVAPRCA